MEIAKEMKTVRNFLDVLFPELAGSFIEVRLIGSGKAMAPVFFEGIEQLAKAMPGNIQEQNGYNVYFGVCPRSRKEGTKDAIKRVFALWADLDGKDFQDGKEAALKRLRELLFPPTIIIDSGHGYHAYWKLKEAEEVGGINDIAKVEGYLKGLARALGADVSAAEVARILRLPGTFNVKDLSAPAPVTIVSLEDGRQYNLSDFEFFLPMPPAVEQKTNPPGWIALALGDLKEGKRNATFAKIAGRLHQDGWQSEDIVELLVPHAERSGFSLCELRREITGICDRYPSNKSFPVSTYNIGAMETESMPLEVVSLEKFLQGGGQKIEWRVEYLLPKEGVGILAGHAGYGKSWMLFDLAIECARGGKWLGYFATEPCRVLYIDEESSPGLLRARFSKLLAAKKMQENGILVDLCVGLGICLTDKVSSERLRQLISTLQPKLVIVDSLIRVHRAEENSASDMSQMFGVVKKMVREFGCAFLFADHVRKPGNFNVSFDQMLRGSSDKVAFVDSLLSLQKKDNTLIVEHSKSRFAEAVPSFVVQIEDKDPGTTTVAYAGEAEVIKQRAKQEAGREFILSTLTSEMWIARKTLVGQARDTGLFEKALDETLKALESAGTIEREDRKPENGRGGKQAFYRIKDNSSPSPEQETETETKSSTDKGGQNGTRGS